MKEKPEKAPVPNDDDESVERKAAETANSKRGRLKIIVMIAVSATLLIICGGLWFSGIAGKILSDHTKQVLRGPVFLKVPEIITNLNGSDGQDSYAKLKVTLELPDAQAAKAVGIAMPRLVDMFQAYLRAMHPNELHGASGTYRLREALISRARIAAAPAVVQNVLFEELIIQ